MGDGHHHVVGAVDDLGLGHAAHLDGTAAAGEDYSAHVGTVSFAPGQVTATVALRILGDTRREGDETFTVELSGPVGALIADGVGLVTIYDDDGARLVAPTSGPGDGSGALTAAASTAHWVRRSHAGSPPVPTRRC